MISTKQVMVVQEAMKCDQKNCQVPAEYYLVWLKGQYYCEEHAQKMLEIGEAMGHPTPAATIAKLKFEYTSQFTLWIALQKDTLTAFKSEVYLYAKRVDGKLDRESETVFRGDWQEELPPEWEELSDVANVMYLLEVADGNVDMVIGVLNDFNGTAEAAH